MISVSRNPKSLKGHDHRSFAAVNPKNLNHFSQLMSTSAWSPIVWAGGTRSKTNFLSCGYMALDFDDGKWTLDTAQDWVTSHDYAAIIGTSKSHMKEKKSPSGAVLPACHRFRVVLPFAENIKDGSLYEYNMRRVMDDLPVDPSCKDAGRFFYPSPVVFRRTGNKYPVLPYDDGYYAEQQAKTSSSSHYQSYQGSGIVPAWCLELIANGHHEGGRHKACYQLGATLIRCGLTKSQITNMILTGPMRDIGEEDVRRAVENGADKAREEDGRK